MQDNHTVFPQTTFDLKTPEGVLISFTVSSIVERILALIFDIFCIGVIILFGLFLMILTGGNTGLIVTMLITFLVRNFYFMFCELRWQGTSPGKRICKLKVIDIQGGQLGVETIIVRNLTREAEILLPLTILTAPELFWPGAPAWSRLIASIWSIIFASIIFFNPYRRRIGDLIAGTLVVKAPQGKLLDDIASQKQIKNTPEQPEYSFTNEQLQFYGEYELQTLEQILRKKDTPHTSMLHLKVSEQIKKKIGWHEPIFNNEKFLNAFYIAQRQYLEKKLLFGKRRKDKGDSRI